MKKKNKILSEEISDIPTIIGTNTKFHGKITGNESVCIDGSFEGEIETQGNIYINQNAKVKAQIVALYVIVHGDVQGDVWAQERLDIGETGKIHGNIKTKQFIVTSGGLLNGNCTMDENIEIKTHNESFKHFLEEGKIKDGNSSSSTKDHQSIGSNTSKSAIFDDLIDTVQDDN